MIVATPDNGVSLSGSARLALIRRVYAVCLYHTESFEEQNIGADLAYFCGAVATGGQCEWGRHRPFVKLLRKHCKRTPHLWSVVKIREV